ncbi:ABC transporter permease [Escherichia coli]
MPLTTWDNFIGKAVPALIVATFQATIVLAIGIWGRINSFAALLALFYFTMVIYGSSLVGFGLLIPSLADTTAGVYRRFVFTMPAILLSGYVSPVENMPVWLQNLRGLTQSLLYGHYQADLFEGCESGDLCGNSLWPLLVINGHDRVSGVLSV